MENPAIRLCKRVILDHGKGEHEGPYFSMNPIRSLGKDLNIVPSTIRPKRATSLNNITCHLRPTGDILIVCWRGLLTKILLSLRDINTAILFNATMKNKIILLEELCDLPMEPVTKYAAWGINFEKLCSASGEMDGHYELMHIFEATIMSHRVVYGAEIDGIFEHTLEDYIELKTNKVLSSLRDMQNFGHKIIKTWAQCYLAGVKHIVVGFRDDSGKVLSLKRFLTSEIPKYFFDDTDYAIRALSHLDNVFTTIKASLENNGPVLKFRLHRHNIAVCQ